MIDAVISVVMTGRRIQSSDSVIGYAPAFGPGLDPRSIRQQQLPVDDDAFATGEPFGDH
jgi:hypothetical protein